MPGGQHCGPVLTYLGDTDFHSKDFYSLVKRPADSPGENRGCL
jgi:hypothetical protein